MGETDKEISMKSIYFFIAFTFFFASCSRNLLYVNNLELPEDKMQTHVDSYKLQPYDYLYISIKSSNQKINDFFSDFVAPSNVSQSANNTNSSQFYLTGFMVNDSGYIYVPWIGTFKVEGLTVNQVRNLIEQKARKIVSDALVKVKLVSFRVYFLGEINNTQTIFYQDKVNVFEAIASVGGIPPSGDKKNVYLLRRQDSSYVSYHLDLTDKNIFSSPQFYLQPDDIIYVKPRKGQLFRLTMQDYTFVISLFTTTLSVVTIILTLTK